ncbi:hypothetical protein GCM10007242_18430 [Pigmentiphaga litoralis]|uniref:alpha/beta hydrolase n=1 Tax=Pigmentiphaga litoralis TaxID=516702 RepID=UPI001672CF41|nr:alpha/beta fold hydrolase [Pigmentiphaga litoralis]GGX12461.1 hypothetical protein GCM10007242_18430 [Pigmentiphaga litoralis]
MLAPVCHDAIALSNLQLHCLDYGGDGPPLLLLHSLSGNTRLFDGLIAAGLSPACRVLVPDLRGRGRSDMPLTGYSLDAGCTDILALLDHFGLDRVVLCGHSFGGLLALYLAAHHPERVSHLVMLDAAVQMHPATPLMTAAVAARLDQVYPSAEIYQGAMRSAPFVAPWHDAMQGFFDEEMQPLAMGAVTTRTRAYAAGLAALHIFGESTRDWCRNARRVQAPTLLVQATQPFLMGMPMVLDHDAEETIRNLPRATHRRAIGNHFTMLYGPGAQAIVDGVIDLLASKPAPDTPLLASGPSVNDADDAVQEEEGAATPR